MARTKRVFIIENPVASRSNPRGLRQVVEILSGAGCEAATAPTTGPGDATRLASEAVAAAHDVVVVYGGDPGPGVLLAPVGGLCLVVGVGLAAIGAWRTGRGPAQ